REALHRGSLRRDRRARRSRRRSRPVPIREPARPGTTGALWTRAPARARPPHLRSLLEIAPAPCPFRSRPPPLPPRLLRFLRGLRREHPVDAIEVLQIRALVLLPRLSRPDLRAIPRSDHHDLLLELRARAQLLRDQDASRRVELGARRVREEHAL